MAPEREPKRERLKGEGKLLFECQMDINTLLAVDKKLYRNPIRLLKSGQIKPKSFLFRGEEYPIDGWLIWERRIRIKKRGKRRWRWSPLRLILISRGDLIIVRRMPGTYPTRGEAKNYYEEDWYVYGRADARKLLEIIETGKVSIPGTNFRHDIEL